MRGRGSRCAGAQRLIPASAARGLLPDSAGGEGEGGSGGGGGATVHLDTASMREAAALLATASAGGAGRPEGDAAAAQAGGGHDGLLPGVAPLVTLVHAVDDEVWTPAPYPNPTKPTRAMHAA